MRSRLPRYLKNNVVAFLALFVALGGTGAYAVNTINSTDIVDGQVKSVDIGNNEIGSADVKDNSLNTFDVHSFLGADVVDGSLTGADVADTSLGPADIQGLSGLDIQNGTLTGDDINTGSLKDEDIAQSVHVNFAASIPALEGGTCWFGAITGINAQGDHLLLTPNLESSAAGLYTYGIFYTNDSSSAYLHVCNITDSTLSATTTRFNLLVFDAQ